MSDQYPDNIPSIRDLLARVLNGQLLGFELVDDGPPCERPRYHFMEVDGVLDPEKGNVYYQLSSAEAQRRLKDQEY